MMKSVSLTWQNLSAHVADKPILQDCSGFCRPGEMLAIMGPSGAGKTTLLSLLSKRNSSSLSVQGQVLANNCPFTDHAFFAFGAFVYQNDLLHANLTVRETLEFAALLKLRDPIAATEKVEELVREFELQKCINTYVGGQLMKGISGGEKKRLCVAIEMVSDPALIVLDEPTSGLDSNKAARLLTVLRRLASRGRTVIFTLHQPSYLQFAKLDRLLLLDKGRTIYQGAAAEIEGYMKGLGLVVPTGNTISDFFMLEISQYRANGGQYSSPLNYSNYTLRLAADCEKEISSISQQQLSLQEFNEVSLAPFLFSFRLILKRDYTNVFRGGWKVRVVALQTLMKFLLLGVLYLNAVLSVEQLIAKPDPIQAFILVQTPTFSNVAGNIMPALLSVALSMPAQRQLYYKETDSRKYSPLPYFLAKVIMEYSLVFCGTILYGCAGYWIVGFTKDLSHFLHYMLVILVASAVGNSLGFFCSTLFREIGRVAAMTTVVMLPLLILSGLFNKLPDMPDWSAWMQYLSPFRYGQHLLLENQYGEETFGGLYDYRKDLGINLSYFWNLVVLAGQGLLFYACSFFLLKFHTSRLAP